MPHICLIWVYDLLDHTHGIGAFTSTWSPHEDPLGIRTWGGGKISLGPTSLERISLLPKSYHLHVGPTSLMVSSPFEWVCSWSNCLVHSDGCEIRGPCVAHMPNTSIWFIRSYALDRSAHLNVVPTWDPPRTGTWGIKRSFDNCGAHRTRMGVNFKGKGWNINW